MTAKVIRASRSDALDNRRRILAAARSLLSVPGRPPSISEIARAAGVGVATVHRHFGTKQALLTQARAEQATLCSTVVAAGLGIDDDWQAFAYVVEQLMAHATSAVPVLGAAELAAERERAMRLTSTLVRRAKDAGVLRADFVVEDLVVAVSAGRTIAAESPRARAAAARRLAALLLGGYRGPVAPGGAMGTLPPPVHVRLPRPAGAGWM